MQLILVAIAIAAGALFAGLVEPGDASAIVNLVVAVFALAVAFSR